jgi:DnaJ-class molecular chaperone
MSKVTVAVTITERASPDRLKRLEAEFKRRTSGNERGKPVALSTPKTVCGACSGVGRILPDYGTQARTCAACGGKGVLKLAKPPRPPLLRR